MSIFKEIKIVDITYLVYNQMSDGAYDRCGISTHQSSNQHSIRTVSQDGFPGRPEK
jgi:hypothetical protein